MNKVSCVRARERARARVCVCDCNCVCVSLECSSSVCRDPMYMPLRHSNKEITSVNFVHLVYILGVDAVRARACGEGIKRSIVRPVKVSVAL